MIPVTKADHRKVIEAIADDEVDIKVQPDAMKFVHKIISGTGRNLLGAYESTKNIKKTVQTVFAQSDSLKREMLEEVQRVTGGDLSTDIRDILVKHKVPKESLEALSRDLRKTFQEPDAYEPLITPIPHADPTVSMVITAILEFLMAELYDVAIDDEDFDGSSVTLENVMSGIASSASLSAYVSI